MRLEVIETRTSAPLRRYNFEKVPEKFELTVGRNIYNKQRKPKIAIAYTADPVMVKTIRQKKDKKFDSDVSNIHFKLGKDEDGHYIEDCSERGTMLEDETLERGERYPLEPNGEYIIRVAPKGESETVRLRLVF